MAKRPDMQVVGAKVAHLRREKGLCAAAFAREIDQPHWLVMLLESAHMEQARPLIDLLPDAVIDEFLREIREVYGVSNRWLTTRYQSPKHPPLPEGEPSPAPLLLPVTIFPEDIITLLDNLMALAQPSPRNLLHNDGYFRRNVKAVTTLWQLQLTQLQQTGQAELADQQRQRFKRLLDQRVAYWMKELNITESNVEESMVTA